mgnify:CR=1 FL=1
MSVHHDKSEDAEEDLPAPEPEPAERPTLKIDVNDESGTPEEVAEKLDEAIAGLDASEPKTSDKSELETDELDEQESDDDDESADDLPKPAVVEEPETDKAVKDIVAKEGDELLEVEDAIKDSEEQSATESNRRHFSLKGLLASKKTRKIVLALLLLGFGAIFANPATRYSALNLAGVRSSSTLSVLDFSTGQPLKNATISVGDITSKTDKNGIAHLDKLKLGKTKLKIERIAFATVEKSITVGWGTNPLGSINLTPKGSQYKIQITDFLSGKSVAGVEAESQEVSARGDANGLVTLTVPQTDASEITIKINSQNYRPESIKIILASKETIKLKLVTARKHIYVSKRSGKYDIYSS